MPRATHWLSIACGRQPARVFRKRFRAKPAPRFDRGVDAGGVKKARRNEPEELTMRKTILAIAAIAAAIGAPATVQAQSEITTGVVRGGVEGIAVDQRPAFREYIVRERVPNYTIPDRVIVGGVLPETGVTYYDVPQTFGVTTYRYTVVNGQTVLVEPRTRRIVQVIE
jgi:Protein of unknown function (DUF1236)